MASSYHVDDFGSVLNTFSLTSVFEMYATLPVGLYKNLSHLLLVCYFAVMGKKPNTLQTRPPALILASLTGLLLMLMPTLSVLPG